MELKALKMAPTRGAFGRRKHIVL